METGEEILMAASRKRRQGSRFLGRRLLQSSRVSASGGGLCLQPARNGWHESIGSAVSTLSRVRF